MSKRIVTFLILTFVCLSTIVNAEEKKEESKSVRQDIVFIREADDLIKDKPRMPAHYADIECYYCDGFIYISFDEPEGNASMTIEDVATAEKGIYTFSTLSPYTINIGEVKGTFRLEISTSEGHTYVGYLTE